MPLLWCAGNAYDDAHYLSEVVMAVGLLRPTHAHELREVMALLDTVRRHAARPWGAGATGTWAWGSGICVVGHL